MAEIVKPEIQVLNVMFIIRHRHQPRLATSRSLAKLGGNGKRCAWEMGERATCVKSSADLAKT